MSHFFAFFSAGIALFSVRGAAAVATEARIAKAKATSPVRGKNGDVMGLIWEFSRIAMLFNGMKRCFIGMLMMM